MSRRNKLEKFEDLASLSNVYENYQYEDDFLVHQGSQVNDFKGKWNSQHFEISQPITLELACGKGDYTLGLARLYPDRNYIGIDVKGNRIWHGAMQAQEEGLKNVAFLRTRIERLESFIGPREVAEIWITFPDPFLKAKKVNRRLTSPNFLDKYRKLIAEDGYVHLKTDETILYDYTLEVLADYPFIKDLYKNEDIYASESVSDELELKTFYEKQHLKAGKKIKYIRFKFS